ncbi:MAG: leucine--tRNA ligase [Planctomycetaceae bacterium]|nr:leucine--tRNA ligase [Planctomycetaceae bacterium]
MARYNPANVEKKWQQYWETNKTFATPRLPADSTKKMYVLDMFPYPSGAGLHVGHPEGYTATDIVCRYQRMRGTSVMHPMGWDAFGLPAEQQAKKTGIPPRTITGENINNFRRQLKMLGFSYDWDRELSTTDVDYFRWTQFIFLVLFDTWFDPDQQKGRPIAELPIPDDVQAAGESAVEKYRDEHRLAYQSNTPVNWCPMLGTVLANEEVVGGVSERGGHPVVRMPMRQWMLRITAYGDRLENDLDSLDWSESIKLLQRNWIGRSTGAEVDFYLQASGASTMCGVWRVECDENNSKLQTPNSKPNSAFSHKPGDNVLRIYTTRPDTLFGATYMVIAPEHPYVERLTTPEQSMAVKAYCEQAARKSDLDRTDLAKDKTGVFTGAYAINPVNGQPVPIWIADYVLISYGTGAIMAVPGHDTRDFEFAKQFNIPILPVVAPTRESGVALDDVLSSKIAFTDDGTAINSGKYDGMPTAAFKEAITADLAAAGLGRKAVNYKLRDWLFSRQHFWGEPFPILHELDDNGQPNGRLRALTPDDLPVDLPKEIAFDAKHNSPEPPLEKSPDSWLYVTLDGKRYKRETNTMPQWAGSCWYYLRFLDPKNDKMFVDPEIEKAWMPVDLYVGGAEHAVLHLLYARFWHKVLYDRGYLSMPEPFQKLVNQGMILGEMEFTGFQTVAGAWVSSKEAESVGNDFIHRKTKEPLTPVKLDSSQLVKKGESFVLAEDESIVIDARSFKMSKSRGNVVNPDDVVSNFGADSLRLYEMFMGPLEAVKPWSMDGVSGVRGFLDRVWRMMVPGDLEETTLLDNVRDIEPSPEQNRMLHKTIKGVTRDIENMMFNTAIAKMMEFTNFFMKQDVRPIAAMRQFVLLLSPFAPHIAEELWQLLSTKTSGQTTLAYEPWPVFDESLIREDTLTIPVQINGKLRTKLDVPADLDAAQTETAARADEKVAEFLASKTIVKTIVVPGRMVNFVVK